MRPGNPLPAHLIDQGSVIQAKFSGGASRKLLTIAGLLRKNPSEQAMWIICGWPLRYHTSIHTPKYALATLIQGVAPALRHHVFEQASHCFYPIHQTVQLRQLSLGQRSPTF